MSEEFKDFIRKCTVMDPEQRMSTTQLLSVRASGTLRSRS